MLMPATVYVEYNYTACSKYVSTYLTGMSELTLYHFFEGQI